MSPDSIQCKPFNYVCRHLSFHVWIMHRNGEMFILRYKNEQWLCSENKAFCLFISLSYGVIINYIVYSVNGKSKLFNVFYKYNIEQLHFLVYYIDGGDCYDICRKDNNIIKKKAAEASWSRQAYWDKSAEFQQQDEEG